MTVEKNDTFNLTFNEIETMIYKIRSIQLFEIGYTGDEIFKLFNGKFHMNTLYNWKKLNFNVEDVVPIWQII